MNICVFDTETINLEKPFCYNIGYIIYNTESHEKLIEKDFVIEQIWHNLPLFHTAYYAEKRPDYVIFMKRKVLKMKKIGSITQEMIRDFKQFNVKSAYAYNSDFDIRVFDFNCKWFKIINPFENLPVFDIRGYAHHFLTNCPEFEDFCEKYQYFTEAGNYSSTAETIFRFITNNPNFIEDHFALSDSQIELEILKECINQRAKWGKVYSAKKSLTRKISSPLKIFIDNKILHEGTFTKKYITKGLYKFTT